MTDPLTDDNEAVLRQLVAEVAELRRQVELSSAPGTPEQEVPLVCFDADICRLFGFSLRTLQRLIRARVFPIPTLPSFDNRRRWSRDAVVAFLSAGEGRPKLRRL